MGVTPEQIRAAREAEAPPETEEQQTTVEDSEPTEAPTKAEPDVPEGEGEGAETTDEGAEPRGTEENTVQARIDELTAKRRQAERKTETVMLEATYWKKVANGEQPTRAEAAAAGLPFREAEPAAPEKPPAKAEKGFAEPRPKRADFADQYGEVDQDAYEDALLAWNKAELRHELAQDTEQQSREAAEQQREQALNEKWQEQLAQGREKYSDFDAVAIEGDWPCPDSMAYAIINSGVGHEIGYYLGKHPAEAKRIAALPDPDQLAEIGYLRAKLEAKQDLEAKAGGTGGSEGVEGGEGADPATDAAQAQTQTRETKAPPPPSAPPGGGNRSTRQPKGGTTDAVLAARQAMLKKQGRA
jgi:hypothetical protein